MILVYFSVILVTGGSEKPEIVQIKYTVQNSTEKAN